MNRRKFVYGSAIAALGACRAGFSPLLAFAQQGEAAGGAGMSVAASLGKSLAGNLVGIGAQFAFGQILSAAGVDQTGLREVNKKLDEILSKLDTLQRTVETLQAQMNQQFASLDYMTQFGYVRPLIDRNFELIRQFQLLCTSSPYDQQGIRRVIGEKLVDGTYMSSLHTWHGAMMGYNVAGSGLIRGWSRAVSLRPSALYLPVDARSVQDHWDFYDAQQAMTVNFLIEQLNMNPDVSPDGRNRQARDLMSEWYGNRAQQLSVLRGNLQLLDTFPVINGSQLADVSTPLMGLPYACAVEKARPVMWFQILSQPTSLTQRFMEFFTQFNDYRNFVTGITGKSGWQMVEILDFSSMLQALGQDWKKDGHYAERFKAAGFTQYQWQGRPPGPFGADVNIWFDSVSAHYNRDGQEVTIGIGRDSDDRYVMCLPGRPDEIANAEFCQTAWRSAPEFMLATNQSGGWIRKGIADGMQGSFLVTRNLVNGEEYWNAS